MEISAVFDNADLAEWTLVRLRERGIHPSECSIHGIGNAYDSNIGRTVFGSYMPTANMTNEVYDASGGSPWVVMGAAPTWSNSISNSSHGREACLTIKVTGGESDRAKSVIISNHGRSVAVS